MRRFLATMLSLAGLGVGLLVAPPLFVANLLFMAADAIDDRATTRTLARFGIEDGLARKPFVAAFKDDVLTSLSRESLRDTSEQITRDPT